MKTAARFVTRLQGDGDGLFIGALMSQGVFKPNTVYEIKEVLGELTIQEVGMACGAGPDNCVSSSLGDGKTMFHWGCEIGHIIAMHGSHMFLTLKEYADLRSRLEVEQREEQS